MTIDTSREAVEQINEELSWDNSFGAIELINALLAERDAALAEVARLTAALETATVEADHFRGEVKLRNRIPATSDLPAELLRRAEAAEAREQTLLMKQTDLINDTVLMGMARDAALAEVARLSTPPDDAEVEAAHREWFSTTYPHTYADVQSDYEARDAFVTSEEAWAAATLAAHAARRKE